jgi:hypothetical protein
MGEEILTKNDFVNMCLKTGHFSAKPIIQEASERSHGPSLSVRHTVNTTEEFANDTADGASTEDGIWVASVSGDELIVWLHRRLHPDRHCFL